MRKRVGMFLADLVLGGLVAGALMPALITSGVVKSQATLWIVTALCVAAVTMIHGTFRRPQDR